MRHDVVLESGERFEAESVSFIDGGWLQCKMGSGMLVRLPPRRVVVVESSPDGDGWTVSPRHPARGCPEGER